MPAGFYWDGILFIIVGTIGLIGSLVTQYSLVPGWRARVKAMRENESEKEAVKEAVSAEEDDPEESDDEGEDSEDEIIDESDGMSRMKQTKIMMKMMKSILDLTLVCYSKMKRYLAL